jgi:hypothetical protein
MANTKLTMTSTLLLILATCNLSITTAAPVADPEPNPQTSNQIGNSYSGAGGHASGGSITSSPPNSAALLGGMSLIDIFSGSPIFTTPTPLPFT